MTAQLEHSVPAWIVNPRPTNCKFGGGDPNAGIVRVIDRLIAVKKLSDGLVEGSVITHPLRSSFHVLHEMQTEIDAYKKYNGKGAIPFSTLKAGIKAKRYPPALAITAPAFGFEGAENRCILGDEAAQTMAAAVHEEGITRSLELKREGLGTGRAIWWPAYDSFLAHKIPVDMVISNDIIPGMAEWEQLVNFWVARLEKTGGTVHLECKHGDPGVDLVCTLELAIKFCQEVNRRLGRIAMFLNHEMAHLLGMGELTEPAMKRTIEAGLFDGFVHFNLGQLLPVKFHDILKNEVHPLDLPILLDWDFACGYGSPRVVADQEATVKLLKDWSASTGNPIYAEHDLHHFGSNAVKFAEGSIRSLQDMWNAA